MPQGFDYSYGEDVGVGRQSTRQFSDQKSKTNLMAKTFLYFGLGLLITLIANIATSLIFKYAFPLADKSSTDVLNEANAMVYLITLGVSALLVIILSVVINFSFLGRRSDHNVNIVPYVLYSIAMGVLLSAFTLFIEWYVLAISIGITVISFGVMALIGLTMKKGAGVLALVALSLGVSLLLLSGFWFILYLVSPAIFSWIYVAISFGYLVFMYIVTIVDVFRIKKMSEQGIESNNLALFFAYQLYVDFIYILIQVLRIVAIFTSKNR